MDKKQEQEEVKEEQFEQVDDEFEVVMEDEESSVAGAAAKVKKLKKQIADLKKEKQDYLTGWQAARAELVNTKKRMEEEYKERQAWSNSRLLEDLLPVADSFAMAMANKEVWESVDQGWRTGIEYIYSQMEKVFAEYGLEKIEAEGQKFDSQLHESVGEEEIDDEEKEGTVALVRQQGFTLKGKILRPAKVIVYQIKK